MLANNFVTLVKKIGMLVKTFCRGQGLGLGIRVRDQGQGLGLELRNFFTNIPFHQHSFTNIHLNFNVFRAYMLVKVFHQHYNFTNIPKNFSPTYKNFSPTCFTNIHLNFYIHQHTFHQHPKIIHQHTEIIHQHTSPTSLQSLSTSRRKA